MNNEEKDLNFENEKVDERKLEKEKLFSKIKKLVKNVSFEDLVKKVGAGVAVALIAATMASCQPVSNNAVIAQAQEAVEQEQSDGTIKEFFKTYGIKYTPIDKSVLTSGAELVPTDFDNRLPDWFITEINDQIFIMHAKYYPPVCSLCDVYWFGEKAYGFSDGLVINDYRDEDAVPNQYFLLSGQGAYDTYTDKARRNDYILSFYSVGNDTEKTFVVVSPMGTGNVYPIDKEKFDNIVYDFCDDNNLELAIWMQKSVPGLAKLDDLDKDK